MSAYGFGIVAGHWGGAIADELGIPFADAMLVPLPDDISSEAAASVADNVSDAYRHIGPHLPSVLTRETNARVLVVGAQSQHHLFTASVSLYAGLTALAMGADEVVLADARPQVRHQARALGLSAMHPKDVRDVAPSPLVCDISGTPKGLHLALAMTAPNGILQQLWEPARVLFNPHHAYVRPRRDAQDREDECARGDP